MALPCPFTHLACVDEVDRFVWQVEQPDRVHNVGSAATEPLCEHTSSHPQILEKGRERSLLFDRAEVFTYEVLDEGELERSGLSSVASTSARMVDSPASCAARQRRSPATISYPSSAGLTITGCGTPSGPTALRRRRDRRLVPVPEPALSDALSIEPTGRSGFGHLFRRGVSARCWIRCPPAEASAQIWDATNHAPS
jgi:hypothetical protein